MSDYCRVCDRNNPDELAAARAEAAAARAEAERLREALRQWKCRSCNGRKVATCGCDKQVCYEWCRSGQPCERCNASGLEPIARDALAEGGSDA